jgi:hypothetical protein
MVMILGRKMVQLRILKTVPPPAERDAQMKVFSPWARFRPAEES